VLEEQCLNLSLIINGLNITSMAIESKYSAHHRHDFRLITVTKEFLCVPAV
jgi:hypothetical protein